MTYEAKVQVTLTWNESGCPIVDVPHGARIQLRVPVDFVPHDIDPKSGHGEPIREVEIEGNSEGLTALAAWILAVAQSQTIDGYHVHLDSSTLPKFFRSPSGWTLTISRRK